MGCFKGVSPCIENSRPYQIPPRCDTYKLQDPFEKERDRLQEKNIIIPFGVDEISDLCNGFVLIPKMSSTVRMCKDLTRLNKTLIKPVHHSPMKNILSMFVGVKYLSIIDNKSGYWNLKLEKKSSYLAAFSYQFCHFRFLRFLFGLSPSGDTFH